MVVAWKNCSLGSSGLQESVQRWLERAAPRERVMNFLVHVREAPRSKLNYFQMSKYHLAGVFHLAKLALIFCFHDYD